MAAFAQIERRFSTFHRTYRQVETPCYLVNADVIRATSRSSPRSSSGPAAKILLALKGFALSGLFPLIARTLTGSAPARRSRPSLGLEEFGREVHTFAPPTPPRRLERCSATSDHILFNSLGQWQSSTADEHLARPARISRSACGSTPSTPRGRSTLRPLRPARASASAGAIWRDDLPRGSTACTCTTSASRTPTAWNGPWPALRRASAASAAAGNGVNFGGGHHITRPGYDLELLIRDDHCFQNGTDVQVYLEPGEAVALNCGYLVTTVLDIIRAGMAVAILDTSVPAHMPDVLEMPYRPHIIGAADGRRESPTPSGSAGSPAWPAMSPATIPSPEPLAIGDRLVFSDMAIYTMVKNTTFNGVELPSIYTYGTGH